MSEEYGWLIEDGKGGYLTFDHIGFARWTADVDEAVRFCRRVDAEKVAAGCEDAWKIVEHGWAPMPNRTIPLN